MNNKARNLSLASFIAGLFGIALAFCGMFAVMGIGFGIVSIILGVFSNKAERNGLATAGIVMAIVGIALCIPFFMVTIICTSIVS